MDKPIVYQVLSTYNDYLISEGVTRRTKKLTRENQEHLESFVSWCGENGVPPVDFCKAVMELSLRTRGSPPGLHRMKVSVLLEEWTSLSDAKEIEDDDIRKTDNDLKQQSNETSRLLVFGVRHAHEKIRATSKAFVCLSLVPFHGGFHPMSDFCPSCELREVCKASVRSRYGDRLLRCRESVTADQVERF